MRIRKEAEARLEMAHEEYLGYDVDEETGIISDEGKELPDDVIKPMGIAEAILAYYFRSTPSHDMSDLDTKEIAKWAFRLTGVKTSEADVKKEIKRARKDLNVSMKIGWKFFLDLTGRLSVISDRKMPYMVQGNFDVDPRHVWARLRKAGVRG